MATWDDVRALALALPHAEEGVRFGVPVWRVGSKAFLWDRPLRSRDLEELGAAAPEGPILGAATDGGDEKLALLQEDPEAFLTTSHFEGYAAILVVLDRIGRDRLAELAAGAWLARAPRRLARDYLANRPNAGS